MNEEFGQHTQEETMPGAGQSLPSISYINDTRINLDIVPGLPPIQLASCRDFWTAPPDVLVAEFSDDSSTSLGPPPMGYDGFEGNYPIEFVGPCSSKRAPKRKHSQSEAAEIASKVLDVFKTDVPRVRSSTREVDGRGDRSSRDKHNDGQTVLRDNLRNELISAEHQLIRTGWRGSRPQSISNVLSSGHIFSSVEICRAQNQLTSLSLDLLPISIQSGKLGRIAELLPLYELQRLPVSVELDRAKLLQDIGTPIRLLHDTADDRPYRRVRICEFLEPEYIERFNRLCEQRDIECPPEPPSGFCL